MTPASPSTDVEHGAVESPEASRGGAVVALVGNPNVGKTTMFNRLVGLNQRTSNFPGTTQDAHVGRVRGVGDGERGLTVVDLPGVYGLGLDASESRVCRGVLSGGERLPGVGHAGPPDAAAVVLDAMNLSRSLALFGEAADLGVPVLAVLTRADEATRAGVTIDRVALVEAMGCPVIDGTRRDGIDPEALERAVDAAASSGPWIGAPEGGWPAWTARVKGAAVSRSDAAPRAGVSDRIDAATLHPVLGLAVFAAVMTGLFWVIFSLAATPMDWIDGAFGWLAGAAASVLPAGALGALIADGVIPGVGSAVIFLPQIVLLFFLIALLEQSGYLARGALLVDRVLRPFGLSGAAFVPLLSSHACAIPGIMSTRTIGDRRERLATILVLPFMSCTARIPVYVLLTTLLFPGRPGVQALAFTGCYAFGIVAGLVSSVVARGTILRGRASPMVLELPDYRAPSVLLAGRLAANRGVMFLRKAGTMILAISVVLWWLGAYPAANAEQEARGETPSSYLERVGGAVQPVFAPLGADDSLTVGILASFIAREVFVSTMAVQIAGDEESPGLLDELRGAQRADGSALFNTATSWALLVYFVLAMQCLPTLVVTAREAGGWKWAGVQFAWMTALAYVGGAIAFGVASALGG